MIQSSKVYSMISSMKNINFDYSGNNKYGHRSSNYNFINDFLFKIWNESDL